MKKLRLTSEDAFNRAESIRRDWEDGKYSSIEELSRAYSISGVYAGKILYGLKCVRKKLPKGNWKPITLDGVNFYISDDGRAWSVSQNKLMLLSHKKEGYRKFTSGIPGGKRRKYAIHRLVLTLFDRAPKKGELGRHLNDDQSNNHISNLAWGTVQDNADDAIRNGITRRGIDVYTAVLTDDLVRELITTYRSGPLETHASSFRDKYAIEIGLQQLVHVLMGKYWNHVMPEFTGYDTAWKKKLDEKAVRALHHNYALRCHKYSSRTKFAEAFATALNNRGYDNVSPRTLIKALSGYSWRSIYDEFN